MKVFLFILCIAEFWISFCISSPIKHNKILNYRLNTDIEPLDYVIDITPYFNDGKHPFSFDGICTITIKTSKSNVDIITLHKQDVDILEQSLTGIDIRFSDYNDVTNKYTLKLVSSLVKDVPYVLKFKYHANLRTDLYGLYLSSYREGNTTKWLAATHMEPIHARKMFPCFDEPRFRATFSIIVNRPAHFKPSLSNMPLATSHSTTSNLVREYFQKTPKISTYLIAVIVSEFDCHENALKNFTVCSRPSSYAAREYSFNFGQKMLKIYDELFNYKYSTHLPKMTMAALPHFAIGGMENWGLISYRESSLSFNPKSNNVQKKQKVAALVAHEQSHMWFGDLVTVEWWSNTFLKEGFATYFEYFGTAMAERNWAMDQQFTVDKLQSVFGVDSLENTLPLSHDANTPIEVKERFGDISYTKGASVIRMFNHTLGHDVFLAGIRNYLKQNALQTGIPEKLYAAFQKEVGNHFNVTELMSDWILQPGYPVLNVNVTNDHIVLSQKRFLQNNPNHQDKTLWKIPITYASNYENMGFISTKPVIVLSEKNLKIDLKKPIDWIIFNVQQSGYYRVNYDDKSWFAIALILQESHSTIHVVNRAQLIDDALTLARFSYMNYEHALSVVSYLRNEMNYIPWVSAFKNFDFILSRFEPNEAFLFKKFGSSLLKTVYKHLGFRPKITDTHLDHLNRNNVLKHACEFGLKECIIDARNEYEHSLQGNYTISPDLAPIVYCSVIEFGSNEEWKYLWHKFKTSNDASERQMILNALGCTKQIYLIKNYFDLILSNEIQLQDKCTAFQSTLTQQKNLYLVFEFISRHHKNIDIIFGTKAVVQNMLKKLASLSTTSEEINKIQTFIDQNDLDKNGNIEKALKGAELNLQWANRHLPTIKKIIKQIQYFNVAY